MNKEQILKQISQILGIKIEVSYVNNFSGKSEQGLFVIIDLDNNSAISEFRLVQLPGCCGICISTGAFVNSEYQNKGIGKLLNSYRILQAKEWGYGALMCTDIVTNEYQNRILVKNNWLNLAQFNNPRTGNDVNIHYIDLNNIET